MANIVDDVVKQRITIPEIKKHPWFLKNLPIEFMEGEEASLEMINSDNYSTQSIEEALAAIQEATRTSDTPKPGGLVLEGSMDLDDIDTDEDIDEVETSGDFVCAL